MINLVGPKITGGFVDLAAQTLGDYVVSNEPDFLYPSRSLVNRYDRIDPQSISYLGDTFSLNLGKNNGYTLTNSWLSSEIFPEFMRKSYDLKTEEKGLPFTNGIDAFISILATTKPVDIRQTLVKSSDCGPVLKNSVSEISRQLGFARFAAENAASCGLLLFPNEKQDFGSIFILEARNVSGLPIRLCISEELTSRCGIYTALDSGNIWKKYVFMIPPQPSGASGYAVHFNTTGIGNEKSVNDIRYAQFIQIPYYRIANLSFVKDGYVPASNGITKLSAKEVNPTLYKADIQINNGQKGLVSLYKAYDQGWHAYIIQNSEFRIQNWLNLAFPFIFGSEIEQHVKVNNWANGWIIEPKSVVSGPADAEALAGKQWSVVIVYLPQYLEYAGFGILLVVGLSIAVSVVLKLQPFPFVKM